MTGRILTAAEFAALDPQPLDLATCDQLSAECVRAWRACRLADWREVDPARRAYLAARAAWMIAYYGGDGRPWNRAASEATT